MAVIQVWQPAREATDRLKPKMAAPQEVSVGPAIASVISELEG